MSIDELMKDEVPNPVIYFGKNRGRYASQCNTRDLKWLRDKAWISPALKIEIAAHLRGRVN